MHTLSEESLEMDNHRLLPPGKERREFLNLAIAGFAGMVVVGSGAAFGAAAGAKGKEARAGEGKPEEEVAPAEDLMREHGLLNRILLIYDESTVRLTDLKADLPMDVLSKAAGIIRRFIEEYHEKLEEDFLFPRFRKAKKQVELVDVLLAQHRAGRVLTERILSDATPATLKDEPARTRLVNTLRAFNRMYRPHEAREDTILFPAFKSITSTHEYASLGEEFEKKEHQLFGEDGFEKMVGEVAELEKKLGIFDLAHFTPQT